jgi:hypothetical protein
VDLQEIVEMAERIHRIAARGVKADGHTLARAFLVERPEIAMRDIAAAIIGVDHDADGPELRHSALHLVDRGPDIDMQRHQRDAFKAIAVDRAPVAQPIVVGAAQSDRVFGLAHA